MSSGSPFGRMMRNGDHKGQSFLSHPHINNVFVFLVTITVCILKIPEVLNFAVMRLDMVVK